MDIERRYASFRVAGRTLTGTAIRYGDVAPEFSERFMPGAFGDVPETLPLNLQHDASIIVVPEVGLSDSNRALEVRAHLPEGSAAVELVRRGALTGFSIEFRSRSERREGGIRVIERAELAGLALVDRPAYAGSAAEVRSARSIRGRRLWL